MMDGLGDGMGSYDMMGMGLEGNSGLSKVLFLMDNITIYFCGGGTPRVFLCACIFLSNNMVFSGVWSGMDYLTGRMKRESQLDE